MLWIDLRWSSGTFVYLSRWEYAILMWVHPQNFWPQQERRDPTDYWQAPLGMYLRKWLFDNAEVYGRKQNVARQVSTTPYRRRAQTYSLSSVLMQTITNGGIIPVRMFAWPNENHGVS